ncbi:anhydro-N-acetylmuramic acid kinase [Longimicrobium sp.]|uniref:anhydro-N-acetylmuramic acid kinase n=1 Tax=Longimicrobium sp. TaxID=2029185 RepID=UPI002B64AC3B|nr:anhydro-N-acetylmuramic acid kinase [Longimicrobium sp.]HSU15525.1 anhydro-N-acetylmuramic acid kinase [Longimicrobium sp.]
MLIIGLMSGTSLDGIDAALVEIGGSGEDDVSARLVRSLTVEYGDDRREAIHAAIVSGSAEALCGLHADLGEWLAEAATRVCAEAGVEPDSVDAIGSHGQTVWHRPPSADRRGATLQLGDAATIAERTGIAVVSDFRTRDVAAGGQGAPLVPWVDKVLFAGEGKTRALQNIGGIGNVTRVPPKGSAEPAFAFDTGPGNALIDAAVELATGGRATFDRDGTLAARGEVDAELLAELMRHPYFAAQPPKSTGREEFGRPFVARLVEAVRPEGDRDWLDLVATLTELTARSIADAYRRWLLPRGVDEAVVTGGGARNPTLMGRIRALLDPLPVRDGAALGIDADAKEAVAFALLAWAHLRGIPANVPQATGAAGPRVLGSFTPGRRGAART